MGEGQRNNTTDDGNATCAHLSSTLDRPMSTPDKDSSILHRPRVELGFNSERGWTDVDRDFHSQESVSAPSHLPPNWTPEPPKIELQG